MKWNLIVVAGTIGVISAIGMFYFSGDRGQFAAAFLPLGLFVSLLIVGDSQRPLVRSVGRTLAYALVSLAFTSVIVQLAYFLGTRHPTLPIHPPTNFAISVIWIMGLGITIVGILASTIGRLGR
jgi:hypothetical protein